MKYGIILETSGPEGWIILIQEDLILETKSLSAGSLLSKTIAKELKTLLQEKDIKKPNYIAAGKGPGSFTGLRVGAALAKALSYGWQIPLFSYPSSSTHTPETLAKIAYEAFLTNHPDPEFILTYPEINSTVGLKTRQSAEL